MIRQVAPGGPLPLLGAADLRPLPARPLVSLVWALARLARPIRSGDVNLYVFYVFVVVLIAYAVYTL